MDQVRVSPNPKICKNTVDEDMDQFQICAWLCIFLLVKNSFKSRMESRPQLCTLSHVQPCLPTSVSQSSPCLHVQPCPPSSVSPSSSHSHTEDNAAHTFCRQILGILKGEILHHFNPHKSCIIKYTSLYYIRGFNIIYMYVHSCHVLQVELLVYYVSTICEVILSAMSLGDWLGGGLIHPKSENSMAVSGLDCKNPSGGVGQLYLLF